MKTKLRCSVCVILSIAFLMLMQNTYADTGDTTIVQTFTFDDEGPGAWGTYSGMFEFPDDETTYERILMYHTLKCDAATQQDNFLCGEWDYLTYTFLTDSTGTVDSTYRRQVIFTVDGGEVDTLNYTEQPVYSYIHDYQDYIVHNETLSLDSAIVGNGDTENAGILGSDHLIGRTQYLWKAEELAMGGLSAGDISGMRLFLTEAGSELRNLAIRLKHTDKETLSEGDYESGDFTLVYRVNTTIEETGWHSFDFLNNFEWDGNSNVVIEFTFDNSVIGDANVVLAEETDFDSGIHVAQNDYYLNFSGPDYIEVPVDDFATIENEITISFWQYGDPSIQPQSDSVFEGVNDENQRVVNSHLPWGNSRIYWDAGDNGGSHDRIDQAAEFSNFAGQWNHWVFTKDADTGVMKMYLNGEEWHSGTGKVLDMAGITKFYIGSNKNTGNNYDGFIDEFAVWNKALDEATIADWYNKDITEDHPNWDDMIAYYQFNDGEGANAMDASINENTASLNGLPDWRKPEAATYTRNISTNNMRPNVVFDQGVYESEILTNFSTDSLLVTNVGVTLYENTTDGTIVLEGSPNHPTEATNEFLVWLADAYTYIYDIEGNILDSIYVEAENTLIKDYHEYYSNVSVFEIGRFITPYGINLSLGPNGFRWVYDVTDYAPILKGEKFIRSGNAQELLDLQFVFIEGTPAREVKGIKNLWSGSFSYQSINNDVNGEPITVTLPEDASSFKVKTRTTGHGFGNGPNNCAEFCRKDHLLFLDGEEIARWDLWNECSSNPVYPQGGTWVYDRAGWCPGDIVPDFDHEITQYVTPGQEVTIDYGIEDDPYYNGNWVLRGQLFTYGDIAHTNDVAITDIIKPTNADIHSRKNPICGRPQIQIKNRGSEPIENITLTYGIKNGDGSPCEHTLRKKFWEGSLAFDQSAEVYLERFNWYGLNANDPRFFVEITEVNGIEDDYPTNNYMESQFTLPPQYPDEFTLQFNTNNAAYENAFTLRNDRGHVFYATKSAEADGSLDNNETYEVDFEDLEPGCYTFHFEDTGEDGVSWWANNDGNGYVRFRDEGGILITFEPDFGMDIVHHFTIGHELGEVDADFDCGGPGVLGHADNELRPDDGDRSTDNDSPKGQMISVYPNPTQGQAFVNLQFVKAQEVSIEVTNMIGQTVYQNHLGKIADELLKIDLPKDEQGSYFVKITTNNKVYTKTILVTN